MDDRVNTTVARVHIRKKADYLTVVLQVGVEVSRINRCLGRRGRNHVDCGMSMTSQPKDRDRRTIEDLPSVLHHLPDYPSPKLTGSSGHNDLALFLSSGMSGIEATALGHRLDLGE